MPELIKTISSMKKFLDHAVKKEDEKAEIHAKNVFVGIGIGQKGEDTLI